MDIVFIAVFTVAALLTFYEVITIEDDMNEKSYRPIIVLIFAIVAWSTSAFLLATPATATVYYPGYTIVTASSNVVIPAYNVTTATNAPLPGYTLLEYGVFAGGMGTLCALFLVMYMLSLASVEISDAVEDIGGHGE